MNGSSSDPRMSKDGIWPFVISMALILPIAAVTGAFVGWASGAALGEWLEYLGVTGAMSWGGGIGGLLAAVLCPAYVAHKVIRYERTMTKTQSERRDTQTS